MSLHPRLTRAGIELVKRFEGLRQMAARLPGGGWTIGYGHTQSAREGAVVTTEQAEALLLYDLDRVARAIDPLIFAPVNANQFAALTAFAFNIGVENFRTSAVLKRVNEGQPLQAALALELWRKADVGGEPLVIDGLVRRRAAEKALFLTPMKGFRPVPTPVVRAIYDASASELLAQEPGLAGAAELRVRMRGRKTGVARLDADAPGAATTEAVNNVTALLQEIVPDEIPPAQAGADSVAAPEAPAPEVLEAQPQPEPEPELHTEPEPEPEAETLPEPEPVPAEAPVVAEQPAAVPAEEATHPFAAEEPPPVEGFLDAEPAQAPEVESEPEPPAETFGRRSTPYLAEPAETVVAPERPAAPAPLQLPVAMLVGLFGAAAFIGSLVAMIYGKATLANLAIGLLGVICMVPAGLKLLLKVFGERPPEA